MPPGIITIAGIAVARAMIKEAVVIYNNKRLHWSLVLNTPQMVHIAYNQQQYKSCKREAGINDYICNVDVRMEADSIEVQPARVPKPSTH